MIHVTLLVLAVLGAAPEQLHQATAALEDLQYQAAFNKLPPQASISAWSREELAEWFSTRALALLGLKRDAEAIESFRSLFSFAPDWVLPDQYGPRVRTVVSSVRAETVKSGVVSLRFESGLLRTTKDAANFARQVVVSFREPKGAVKVVKLPFVDSQPAPWPREKSVEVWGQVLGLEGSTLYEWGSEPAPLRIQALQVMTYEVKTPAQPPSSPGLGALGVVGIAVGAAGLVAGGLGTGFALGSQDAQRALAGASRDSDGRITSLTQRDAFALDARVAGDAGGATALFISSGVLVAAGVGLVVFDRMRVTPAAGGALLTVPLDSNFAFAGVSR